MHLLCPSPPVAGGAAAGAEGGPVGMSLDLTYFDDDSLPPSDDTGPPEEVAATGELAAGAATAGLTEELSTAEGAGAL